MKERMVITPDEEIEALRRGEPCEQRGLTKCAEPEGCFCAELADLITVLTARAEVAEEDAAEAWGELVRVHLTYAKRGGDNRFAENRRAYLARQEKANARLA